MKNPAYKAGHSSELCLTHELELNGILFKLQHSQPVEYKGVRLNCGYRVDLQVTLQSRSRVGNLDLELTAWG